MFLKKSFYNQPTLKLAQDLLGKFIIRQYRGKKYIGLITETEAYVGPRDKASHASRGRTPRTEIMFGPAGRAYIYLIYGMYYCFNIVTERKDYPAAVLIRSVQAFEPIPAQQKIKPLPQPLSYSLTNGPGKLCQYFKINKSLNNLDLTKNKQLWLEDLGIKPLKIKKLPRVGVDYAEEYKDKKWRYLNAD